MRLNWVSKEKRKALRHLKRQHAIIDGHFDHQFYLTRYPDVRDSGGDPVEHYLKFGHDEGRNPRPDFDTRLYLHRNPDVARAGFNGFVHYVQFGQIEGRSGEPNMGHPAVYLTGEEAYGVELVSAEMSTAALEPPLADIVPGIADLAIEQRLGIAAQAIRLRPRKHDARLLERAIKLQKAERAGVPVADLETIDEVFANHVLAMAKGKTLSFDIWDTLLRRCCCPDETKLRSARAVWLKWSGRSDLVNQLHPTDIFQLRRIAEAAVADDHFEYRIENVAEQLADWLGLADEAFVEDFLETEIRIEKASIRADPTTRHILDAHHGRTIAISDFYLSGAMLSDILAHGGCGAVEKVYASCDYIKTKRVGELFTTVAEAEGIAPSGFVHVGDRHDADVDKARLRGFSAVHFVSVPHGDRAEAQAAALWQHVAGDEALHGARILDLVGVREMEELPLSAMAIVAIGFVMDIMERAIRTNVDKVFFFTREGAFFKKIYDALVAKDQFDIGTYPESILLEVSRRATFAASMEDFNVTELMRLWTQYSHQSLSALAASLNIDPELWREKAAEYGIDLNAVIIYPWQDKKTKAFLSDSQICNGAREAIWGQRKELLRYLEVAGFDLGTQGHRLIVDIGWRGTIQDNIARITGHRIHGCYLGLEKFLNRQQSESSKSGYIMDVNAGSQFTIPEYAGLEFLFNAPGGSVAGYRDGKAVRDIVPGEEHLVCGVLSDMQEQLLKHVAQLAEYVRNHGITSCDIRDLAREVLDRYCQNPPPEIVSAFYDLEHNESFGVGLTDVMACDEDILNDMKMLDGAKLHGALTRALGKVRWNAAFVRTDSFRSFLDALTPSQKIEMPILDGAPALVRRESIGHSRIAILSPSPIKGSGGHRTIYNMARSLANAGYHVDLMHESFADADTQQWVESVIDGAPVHQYSTWFSGIYPTAAISTIWYSPFFVEEFWKDKTLPFYFVQDAEAHFNPVGDTFLRAERSYSLGHNHICIGRWLPHVLGTQFGMGAASAGLGVDHSIYAPLDDVDRRKKIAFLFQPEKYRRAPELCIDALKIVKEKIPDVVIDLYGSNNAWHVPFPHNQLGLVKDLHSINRIYNEASVGLCVSSTNPSRIPFEMMAAGCVPVDIYRYNNLFDYDNGTGVLAYASPASLADAMIMLLSDDDQRSRRATNGIAAMRDRTLAWETDVAVRAVSWGLESGSFDELMPPRLSYTDQPIVAHSDATAAVSQYLAWQRRLASLERDA